MQRLGGCCLSIIIQFTNILIIKRFASSNKKDNCSSKILFFINLMMLFMIPLCIFLTACSPFLPSLLCFICFPFTSPLLSSLPQTWFALTIRQKSLHTSDVEVS